VPPAVSSLPRYEANGASRLVKNESEVSKQVDVLIVDENDAGAYLYQEDNLAIVRPRAVVAAIEVKTSLGAKAFEEAILNIASVKGLAEKPNEISGLVVGYESPESIEGLLDSWFKRPGLGRFVENPELAPELVSFLRKHRLLIQASANQTISGCGQFRLTANVVEVGVVSSTTDDGDDIPDNTSAREGWQIQMILASIYTACLKQDADKLLPDSAGKLIQSQIQELKQMMAFSGTVSKSDHYEFGCGYVPPPQHS
jgi:hypothetical protein